MTVKDSVRAVWQDVLKSEVGDESDFFGLGGDSLAALTICTRLEELYQIRPKLRVLFDRPRFGSYADEFSRIVEEAARC